MDNLWNFACFDVEQLALGGEEVQQGCCTIDYHSRLELFMDTQIGLIPQICRIFVQFGPLIVINPLSFGS